MDWKTKARVFRMLSALPLGSQLHYQLQRRITKQWPRRAEGLNELLTAAKRIIGKIPGGPATLNRSQFLEVGAGRDMAVAISLRLLGVGQITCIDVNRLAKLPLIAHAARFIANGLRLAPPEIKTWNDLERFGINYLAPIDIRDIDMQARSIDCFFTVDTLEHIPRSTLPAILKRSAQLLSANGRSVHLIDYSDHYARDGQVSRFNFLTFSDQQWAPFNSGFQYVNRLRHSEYIGLFLESGFRLVDLEIDFAPPDRNILDNLAERFRAFDEKDLFAQRSLISAAVAASPAVIGDAYSEQC